MSILTYALQVFRYFNTNNVPSSGNHEPVKSEIQALFGLIDSSYNDLAIAITAAGENVIVVPVLNNVSDLSLSYPAGTLAFAMSGNAAGIYLKSGGSGSGSWTLTNLSLTSQLVAALQSAIGAEEAARIAADNALRDAIDAERSDRIQAVSAEEQSRKDADTDIIIQSPNEEHAGDAPLYFTNNLTGGDPADVARNLPGPVVSNADGYSVRITGAGTLSVRTLYPVEAGRTYVVRYAVRRIANSPDPANDSVRCALAWYNQDRSAIGGTPISVVQDLNDLTTGSGRVVVTAYVSRAAGDEIDVVAPANTRYVRPFVQTFGTTCQTDIEVISWSDVTDAAIYSPDVSDLVSRVGALESIDAGPRLDIIEAELNSPGVLGFRTVFDVAAYDVPVSVTAIVVSGYYAPGDGGSAFYKRSSGEPSHGGKVQSADGAWWEITGNKLDVRAFGAVGDGTSNDGPPIERCLGYFSALGGGEVCLPEGLFITDRELKIPSNVTVRGLGIGLTTIKADGTVPLERNVLTNAKNDRLERSDYDVNINIEDLTVDANWQERAPTSSGSTGGQASCIKYSTVKNCNIRRVRAINGILHCIDIMASVYWDDEDPASQPPGISYYCVIEDCIAENSSRDDGITTHNSGHIQINRCYSFFDGSLYTVGANQQGIEIDEGSFNVSVTHCYVKGWVSGYQVKGHTTTRPAIDVVIEDCIADDCTWSFHVEHTTGTIGRNVTIRDCISRNVVSRHSRTGCALSLRDYSDITVENFQVEGNSPGIAVQFRDAMKNARLSGITFKDGCSLTGSESGLIHVNAGVGANAITIENVVCETSIACPVVRYSSVNTVKRVRGISATGTDDAVGCVWANLNANDEISDIRQTGYGGDIWSPNLSAYLSNNVEVARGLRVYMSGTSAPESSVPAPLGTQYTKTSATATLYIKATAPTINTGWVTVGSQT